MRPKVETSGYRPGPVARDEFRAAQGADEAEQQRAVASAARTAMAGRGAQPYRNEGVRRPHWRPPKHPCYASGNPLHVSNVVYGAGRDDVHQMYFEDRHPDTVDFIREAYKDDLSLEGGRW